MKEIIYPTIKIEIRTADKTVVTVEYPSYPIGVFNAHIEAVLEIVTKGLSK